ncbi:unnamed protein product [Dovyalis caffra]|uniref:Uncharacterized protein n=1 Tax=Dovyalis caffra TaxID=77055 RepID=A0AAV1SFY1_9ROSI|nr:unnamed protein product [Dovyalis caffra]
MSEVVMILEGKSKMKASSFNVPYSADDFAKAKAVACLIPYVRSGNNCTERSSNVVSYDIVSQDEDAYGIFEDCSSEMVDKTDSLTNLNRQDILISCFLNNHSCYIRLYDVVWDVIEYFVVHIGMLKGFPKSLLLYLQL